jgi:hypothetical protein
MHINDCPVKFYFYSPVITQSERSTDHLVIISFGEHNHPPPPMRRLSDAQKKDVVNNAIEYGLAEATARKLFASMYCSLILTGKENQDLTCQTLALMNPSILNHIIRVERTKQFPTGTDFLGAQHEMTRQDPSNPYIRECMMYPDGQFMIICMFPEQARLWYDAAEIHIDKTFKRTKCRELEINTYSHEAAHLATIARVYFDAEDEVGYYRAFTHLARIAEQDMQAPIPWGHLTATGLRRIKAILVDEHGGQAKGLARFFGERYPSKDGAQHLLEIVKTCHFHYDKSITTLENKKIPKGT